MQITLLKTFAMLHDATLVVISIHQHIVRWCFTLTFMGIAMQYVGSPWVCHSSVSPQPLFMLPSFGLLLSVMEKMLR
jgi:hypothetical protein